MSMREHYEALWQALPAGARAPDLDARRDFMLAAIGRAERVLDVGCGDGELTAALAGAGARVVGVDVAQAALERARAAHPQLELARVELDAPLPFADGEFGAVCASEVIEHVADTAGWMSELRRVLAPGGTLALTTPCHGRVKNVAIALTRFERHADPRGDHLRFYTRRSLAELLLDFGFEELAIATLGGAPLLRRTLAATARRASWRPQSPGASAAAASRRARV